MYISPKATHLTIRSGTIRKCSLTELGMALLEWMWLCWSRCGLVPVGMALLDGCSPVVVGVVLLEEVCYWGERLKFQKLKQGLMVHFLFPLPANPNVDLSAT